MKETGPSSRETKLCILSESSTSQTGNHSDNPRAKFDEKCLPHIPACQIQPTEPDVLEEEYETAQLPSGSAVKESKNIHIAMRQPPPLSTAGKYLN